MNSDSENNKKIILIFLASLIITLIILTAGDKIIKYNTRQKMISYARSSFRESDGAENLVIMDGKSGRIGSSNVILKYLKDGYVSIKGINSDENGQWKKIAELELQPGTYTLTGLKNSNIESIALWLNIQDPEGKITNYWQYDEDVPFFIINYCQASLHFRVAPYTEIDTIARPAVYKDE